MRFLLDVHIGTSFAHALAGRGHDVIRAALAFPTWHDEDLLALAVAEQQIIITQDSDFTDLIYAYGKAAPPAILYLRCEPEELQAMVSRVLDTLDSARFYGHMTVIRRADTRYRPFPGKSETNA